MPAVRELLLEDRDHMAYWNPWHGCHKISPGCQHCYVYRIDGKHGRDSSIVTRNAGFGLPVRRGRDGAYKIAAGETVYTCFSSDFLVEEADAWRPDTWRMIRERDDLHFFFITKRIDRLAACVPEDWGEGYGHVTVCCTVENQAMADVRLPVYMAAPVRHRRIVCEPLLGPIDLSPYLDSRIEQVIVGGESGPEARICDYAWVLDIRRQCAERHIPFVFRQTGAHLLKDGRLYRIRRRDQFSQARKAAINIRIR